MLAWNLAGNADIERLQKALAAWAQAKGGAIPPQVTGQLDPITLYSAIQVFPLVVKEIPGASAVKPIFSLAKQVIDMAGGLGAGVAVIGAVKSRFPTEWASFEQTVASQAGNIAKGIEAVMAFTGANTSLPTGPSGKRPMFVGQKLVRRSLDPRLLQPKTSRYPSGTIHYFNTKKKTFIVAVPTLDGSFQGLGAYGEPLGAKFERQESSTDPTTRGSTPVPTPTPHEEKPFYKKWWFWAALGGSAAIVGGTLFVLRR